MADRTPDPRVLDQDAPSAKPSGEGHEPDTELAEKNNGSGRPSGEATAETEPAQEPGTPDEAIEPTSPEATKASETADAAEEPETREAAPESKSPEATETPKATETPETPEATKTAEPARESQAPEETQQPDRPDDPADAPAADPAEPKAPAGEPAEEGAQEGDEDDDTAPDEDPDTVTGSDDTASEDTIDPPAENDDTTPPTNPTATAAEHDPGQPPKDEPEEAAPAKAPEEAASARTSEEPSAKASEETPSAKPEEPTTTKPEDPPTPENSESTRTLALRPPQGTPTPTDDKTMAIGVAGLPRAQSEEAPPAPSPIDLLAQLTNTPPPPATPARTVLRRIKIWSPLVAVLALVLLVVQMLRPLPDPALALDPGASSFTIGGEAFSMPWPEEGQAAVMVVGSGSLGTFGAQKPVPTASVAKIMTAYVVLRGHPLKKDEPGPSVTVDARTVEEGRSKDESRIEGLRLGQEFSLQDMLKMLMIPSGNNVARLLARWDTKSDDETAFVRKMNDAAKSLGMKNTTYTDPSGLDKGTVSTAVDQLKLAEAVMKFDSFRAVVAMPNADIPGVGRIYNNNDRLIVAGLSVRGIKTGSNTAAGGTLSWAAYRTVAGEDRLILGSMMDQHVTGPDPNGANSLRLVQDNSEKVIRAVREALTSATAVKKGQVVGYVDDGLGGRTPLVATKDLEVVGVPGQKLTLTLREGGEDLVGGTKAGAVVGELAVGGGAGAPSVPVALRSEFEEPSVGAKLTRIG